MAGCASSPESASWRAFSEKFPQADYTPLDDLLARDDIDAFVVTAAWRAMPGMLPRLLAHPKPMLLEKPIEFDAKRLAAAIDGAGAAIGNKVVGMNRRFYDPVIKLKQRLQRGGLIRAEIVVSENLENLVKRWGAEILPHVLAYSSCHILDVAQFLLGTLRPAFLHAAAAPGFEPFVNLNGALMSDEHNALVSLAINAFEPSAVGITCAFNDRTVWRLNPMEVLTVYEDYDKIEPTEEYPVRRYQPRPIRKEVVNLDFRPGFLQQMEAFLAGRRESAATPQSFLTLLEWTDAARRMGIAVAGL
ncbi:hypothetical protein MAIT1_00544 [Magnetofaba australis IT-1]|uniref:Oxidoreductase domain-containing protein n=1 Tax=Magnetofaba australis IT-1 TaxID=1434232 RepID=A0A1Y2JZ02_9PROT|nr:hypothetical protein MAIT1_00544 [Magnetofaba australis IT-1]